MKITLSNYSRDGMFTDVRRMEIGFQCPYAFKLECGRFSLTLYRWSFMVLCISMANSFPQRGGPKEDWADWVIWQDRPFRRFYYWKKGTPITNPA